MKARKDTKPPRLDNAPLEYAPENEHGVVFLFAALAKRWSLRVESVQAGFPDCIAYQRTGKGDKRKRIEFEFCSSNFKLHGHDPKGCDWIVCWEHDWPEAPKQLEIVELRREFGLGFNVWIMPVNARWQTILAKRMSHNCWSVASQCHKGDLILYYFTRPEGSISHVFEATERAWKRRAGRNKGTDYAGAIKRVCSLKSPLFFEDFRNDRVLSTAHFVRGKMRGRPNATEYWSYLYDMIVRKNPPAKQKLRKFAPWNR